MVESAFAGKSKSGPVASAQVEIVPVLEPAALEHVVELLADTLQQVVYHAVRAGFVQAIRELQESDDAAAAQ